MNDETPEPDGGVRIHDDLVIPSSELDFTYSTGGGPGGQHVNRSATRVALQFDVAHSPSLDEQTRARLFDRLGSRLDSRGVLRITVHESRSQYRNRAIAVQRLRTILADALREEKERTPTEPSRSERERRIVYKRRRSAIKRDRRRNWSEGS